MCLHHQQLETLSHPRADPRVRKKESKNEIYMPANCNGDALKLCQTLKLNPPPEKSYHFFTSTASKQASNHNFQAETLTLKSTPFFSHPEFSTVATAMSGDRPDEPPVPTGGENGVVEAGETSKPASPVVPSQRLRLNPNKDHKPDSYEDLQLDFSPSVFSSLERYLPPSMLTVSRDDKVQFMSEIMLKYWPHGDRNRVQKHREYRQQIISHYQPLHRDLYTMDPTMFFSPSFLEAVADNTEESFRNIMFEPSPGIFTFEMLQPQFCELLLEEVENFEKWVGESKFRIMRPNTMNKYGAVLDDFGLETMLDKLMEDYIRPISKVFFPEVGGSSLDSHHGFIVEYGSEKDADLGFHVDDSEVTLNVCLGKQYAGGELFFRGMRCDKHVNTGSQLEEIFDYSHVPARAVLHRGRHRHGARATTSGHRVNLLLWCRSSVFREMKKYQKDFSSWCGECLREKKERQRLSIAATRSELLRQEGEELTT